MKNFHELSVQDIDGNSVALSAYEGKVKLVVNTASQCGYTPQFAGLQSLYEKYEAKGLVVLGFPSNDFGGQDPGSDEEIKNYCAAKYDVSFPMFSKSHVTGAEKNELYALLTSEAPEKGEVGWNFEKFLVSRDGQVLSRFRSR
ncbi:MAG: glutathione peroxidase, partial [Bdellovibrionales bacterium]|nr:glutathione peroxidase [Bdellovibrionales bacterium]